MKLKEFILKYLDLSTYIRIYVNAEDCIGLWCDYRGEAKDLLLDEDRWSDLLSSEVYRIYPSFKKIQAILDIHIEKTNA